MGAKVVFMRRIPKEIEIFGGDVFIDIDGKNVGKLGSNSNLKPLATNILTEWANRVIPLHCVPLQIVTSFLWNWKRCRHMGL